MSASPSPSGTRVRRPCGFTLIEVTVAVAILAVVALLAYRATAAMVDGEARLAAESARWRTLDRFFARLEGDLREAIPRGSRHGGVAEPAWQAQPVDNAGNTTLAFTRAGPDFSVEPGAAGQRIGYRLNGGRIEIVYWPQLDNVDDARAVAYPVVDGVRAFRVTALGTANAWRTSWPVGGDIGVPRAVRIELELADGAAIGRTLVLR